MARVGYMEVAPTGPRLDMFYRRLNPRGRNMIRGHYRLLRRCGVGRPDARRLAYQVAFGAVMGTEFHLCDEPRHTPHTTVKVG